MLRTALLFLTIISASILAGCATQTSRTYGTFEGGYPEGYFYEKGPTMEELRIKRMENGDES